VGFVDFVAKKGFIRVSRARPWLAILFDGVDSARPPAGCHPALQNPAPCPAVRRRLHNELVRQFRKEGNIMKFIDKHKPARLLQAGPAGDGPPRAAHCREDAA
jgi:hypothetical protein